MGRPELDESAGMFRLPKSRFNEARYVIAGSGRWAKWARYEVGCELCGWWRFEGRRFKAYWHAFRHTCRTPSDTRPPVGEG